MKSTKNNTPATETRGPGRPAYQPKFPQRQRWTLKDLMAANGVDKESGKGDKCTKLTLVKYLDKVCFAKIKTGPNAGKPDRNAPLPNSLVVRLKETLPPDSEEGLGRRSFVYCLRAKLDQLKAPKAPKSDAVKSKGTGKSKKTLLSDYEAQKAALLAESPTVVSISPVAADPVAAESVTAESVAADPVTAESVTADPVLAEPVRAEPVATETPALVCA